MARQAIGREEDIRRAPIKAADGVQGKSSDRESRMAERLMRKKNLVALTSVVTELNRCVRDAALRTRLHEKAQEIAVQNPEKVTQSMSIDIDAYLLILMQVSCAREARRR